jgi:uncharacterized protein
MTQRAEAKGVSAARAYYRRTPWLLPFGLLHGYLLWCGDILFLYGVCGLLIQPGRNASPVCHAERSQASHRR